MKIEMKNLYLISIIFLSNSSIAQVVVEPLASLFIGGDAILSINGGVVNDGSFQNLGLVTFTGDWSNTNLYNDGGTGQLEANGPDTQSITNNDQSVGNLNINAGTEVMILGNTFEVMDELILTNGIVRLGPNTSLIINENATITGGSVNSFVEGTIVQKGGGGRFYPLGIESFYLPFTLLDIPNVGNLEMSVGIGLFNTAGVTPQPSESVIGVSNYHYWEVNTLQGTFDGSLAFASFDNADVNQASFGTAINNFNFAASTVSLVQSAAVEGDYIAIRNQSITITDLDVVPGNEEFVTATFGTIDTVRSRNPEFCSHRPCCRYGSGRHHVCTDCVFTKRYKSRRSTVQGFWRSYSRNRL